MACPCMKCAMEMEKVTKCTVPSSTALTHCEHRVEGFQGIIK